MFWKCRRIIVLICARARGARSAAPGPMGAGAADFDADFRAEVEDFDGEDFFADVEVCVLVTVTVFWVTAALVAATVSAVAPLSEPVTVRITAAAAPRSSRMMATTPAAISAVRPRRGGWPAGIAATGGYCGGGGAGAKPCVAAGS